MWKMVIMAFYHVLHYEGTQSSLLLYINHYSYIPHAYHAYVVVVNCSLHKQRVAA